VPIVWMLGSVGAILVLSVVASLLLPPRPKDAAA
jgi:hypothetical protein